MPKPREVSRHAPVCLLLLILIATAAVYWQVGEFKFVAFDDDRYVTANPVVMRGLSLQGVTWALTAMNASNWHPLTWVSHMLDVSAFGMNAGSHHLVNLFLHLANTALLFWLITSLTGYPWRALFVAGLFALHPLHVESVAWVAERKDVLSTLLWLLTTIAYVGYVRSVAPAEPARTDSKAKPGKKAVRHRVDRRRVGSPRLKYALAIVLFALGLMAKPMLVSLPFTLLLLDRWPLQRRETWKRLILEKAPLFALVAASCVITLVAQKAGHALASLDRYPLWPRLVNASIAYIIYLCKMLWPVDLACLYPHPGTSVSIAGGVLSGLAVIAVTLLVLRRRIPYLTFGWLWYVITLVPVIGIAQVGVQAYADRYTYLPLVGIFVIMTWGVSDLLARRPSLSRLAAAAAVIVLGVLGWLTYVQAGFWHDDFTLFKHAIAVTGPNRVIHHNLAMAYSRIQDYGAAEEQFREAISARPTADDYSGLGAVLLVEGRPQEAAEACETAVQHAPNLAMAHQNLGAAYAQLGRPDLASDEFIRAIELDPRQAKAHLGLARVLAESNRLDEAIEHFEAAVRVEPGNVPAWLGLAACLVRVGRVDEATQQLRLAVDHNPSNSDLANALSSLESGIVGGGR